MYQSVTQFRVLIILYFADNKALWTSPFLQGGLEKMKSPDPSSFSLQCQPLLLAQFIFSDFHFDVLHLDATAHVGDNLCIYIFYL